MNNNRLMRFDFRMFSFLNMDIEINGSDALCSHHATSPAPTNIVARIAIPISDIHPMSLPSLR